MKNKFLLFLFVCLCLLFQQNTAYGQYFQVKDASYKANYHFPLVKNNSQAAKNISDYLWGMQLHVLPEYYKGNPYKYSGLLKEDSSKKKIFINYKILRNDSHVFSVKISSRYPWEGLDKKIYNFDAQTGYYISFFKLLKAKRRKGIAQSIHQDRGRRLSQYLKTLDSTQNPQRYAVYKGCRSELENRIPWEDNIAIYRDSVVLIHPSCGYIDSFKMQDHAPIYKNVLRYKEIRRDLTGYGKCVVHRKRRHGHFRKSDLDILHRVYRGEIKGKYPVTFILEFIAGMYTRSIFGEYFYDKYGIALQFRGGHTDKNHLKFVVKDKNKKITETFKLTILDNRDLKGTWSDGVHTYPVYFK